MPTVYQNPAKPGSFLPTLLEISGTKKAAGVPKEAAWIWGPEDEVGRLNLLTADHVQSVITNEPRNGLVSSLNWELNLPRTPGFGRQTCTRRLKPFEGVLGHDDIIELNTQSGSQLDGFRHLAHQSTELYYNSLKQQDIIGGTSHRCGIQAASRRGIVGRGVLLDFAGWADEKGIKVDPFDSYAISLEQLLEVAAWEGVEFQCGDILLIRTGWIRKYNKCLADGMKDELTRAAARQPTSIGVKSDEDMKTWLHDQYFAVVGGDQPAFEVWPPPEMPILHEYLLACWGIMIGEMLDLEDLSEKCKRLGKYSFVFTSAPMNLPGGVASLANALCIL